MRLGIFAKTFPGVEPGHGARGGRGGRLRPRSTTWPAPACRRCPMTSRDETATAIAQASAASGVALCAVSGTYNMIHPDPSVRGDGLRRLAVLIAARRGDRHRARDALHRHARPGRPVARTIPTTPRREAWRDLRAEMEKAVAIAERHDFDLGIEPELANVVDSPRKARRLIDEIGERRPGHRARPGQPVRDGRTAGAAPDRRRSDRPARPTASPWPTPRTAPRTALSRRPARACSTIGHYIARLRAAGFDGDLVTHGLAAARGAGRRRVPARLPAMTRSRPHPVHARTRRPARSRPTMPAATARPSCSSTGSAATCAQVAEAFPDGTGFRLITLECRGHGASEAGRAVLHRDLRRRCRGADRDADRRAGGARRHLDGRGDRHPARGRPGRTSCARWSSRAPPGSSTPAPANMRPNAEVGDLLARLPAWRSPRRIHGGRNRATLAREAPDNLASLLGFFERAPQAVTASLLQAISADGPGISEADLGRLATAGAGACHAVSDAVHPLAPCRTAGRPDTRCASCRDHAQGPSTSPPISPISTRRSAPS